MTRLEPENPRAHRSSGHVQASIESLGFVDAIVTDDRTGKLIAGHGRVNALAQLQDTGMPPPPGVYADDADWRVPVVTGWASDDDDQARRALLALNRTTETGGWIDEALLDLLQDLQQADEGLAATGFTDEDVAQLRSVVDASHDDLDARSPDPGLTDPDDAPDASHDDAPAVCQPGDLWQLGEHLLACGDARDPYVWNRLVGGPGRIDMVWTDPPYGVAYSGKTADALTIENDQFDAGELSDLLLNVFGHTIAATRAGACWYVAAPPGPLHCAFGSVLNELGVWRQTIAWVKDQFVLGRSDYHYRHESIFYGWTPGAAHHAVPDRTQDTVHEVPRPRRAADHPTMKPVELIERHLSNSTDRDELVVDPFGGSGSTLIAAHRTGRRASLIELDPKYADVACRRWQEYSDVMPVRWDTGEKVDFVAAHRA